MFCFTYVDALLVIRLVPRAVHQEQEHVGRVPCQPHSSEAIQTRK